MKEKCFASSSFWLGVFLLRAAAAGLLHAAAVVVVVVVVVEPTSKQAAHAAEPHSGDPGNRNKVPQKGPFWHFWAGGGGGGRGEAQQATTRRRRRGGRDGKNTTHPRTQHLPPRQEHTPLSVLRIEIYFLYVFPPRPNIQRNKNVGGADHLPSG